MEKSNYKIKLSEIFDDVKSGRVSVERAEILIKILDRLANI